jgi:hypothetical protein
MCVYHADFFHMFRLIVTLIYFYTLCGDVLAFYV